MRRVNSFFLWEQKWKALERRWKGKDEYYFSILYGRDVTRVYSQREYERNVYTFPILYLVPRRKLPFIFRQRGVIALLEKAGIPGKCKEAGTGAFERMIAGETYMYAPTVRY